MADKLKELVTFFILNYATITIIGSTILGALYFLRKWIINGIKSIELSNSFHEHFGTFPAKKIKDLHNTISRSSNTLELRQSISEKHMQIGIYICEAETGRCVWTNDFLNELFEMDSTHMKDYGWAAAIHESDSAKILDIWREAVTENNPYYAEYKIKGRLTNRVKHISTHAIAVTDENHQKLCYVGYMYEIK